MVPPRPTFARPLRTLRSLALLAAFGLSACAPFYPEELPDPVQAASRPTPTTRENDVGTGNIRKKLVARADGIFSGKRFVASVLTIDDDDSDVQVKGDVVSVDPVARTLRVGAVDFGWNDDTEWLDEKSKKKIVPSDLAGGNYVKIESEYRDEILTIRKLTRRVRKDGELDSVKGRIEDVSRSKFRFTVAGIEISYVPDSPVVWKRSEPAPDLLRQDASPVAKSPSILRQNIRKVGDDDARPEDQIRVFDNLVVSGELKHELEWRENFDLQSDRQRDRLIGTQLVSLEATFELNRHFMAYARWETYWDYIWFDEDANLTAEDASNIIEGWALFEDLPVDGLALQVGRVDFDHGREWVMDDQYDAVRLLANLDGNFLEASIGRKIWDPSDDEEGVENTLLAARIDSISRTELLLYYLHRQGGTLIDLDRDHVGVSAEVDYGPGKIWGEFSYARGTENDLPLEGVGGDVTMMYVWEKAALEPSVYAGFAMGTGDYDPFTAHDRGFRQTGLNDNQDKYNGVASFNYYGEIMAPDLTNLKVFTVGLGVKPSEKTSVDLLWHRFEQVDLSYLPPFGTRLRQAVTAQSTDLGQEFDVIIGIEESQNWIFEVNVGIFMPGDAFNRRDTAYYGYFKAAYRF